jgi:hypothetical protein
MKINIKKPLKKKRKGKKAHRSTSKYEPNFKFKLKRNKSQAKPSQAFISLFICLSINLFLLVQSELATPTSCRLSFLVPNAKTHNSKIFIFLIFCRLH